MLLYNLDKMGLCLTVGKCGSNIFKVVGGGNRGVNSPQSKERAVYGKGLRIYWRFLALLLTTAMVATVTLTGATPARAQPPRVWSDDMVTANISTGMFTDNATVTMMAVALSKAKIGQFEEVRVCARRVG